MHYFRNMIDKIKNWFRRRSFYVICDPADNSVTLSKALFKHMGVMEKDESKVYVFFIPEDDCYGFILNPNFNQETQLADIQYNGKYKTIGFECLVPTVGRIFYDYRLPHEGKVKLSVQVCHAGDIDYYKICRPRQ
jgi:hypothetical protein